jgi:hypothetical protein
VDHKLGAVFFVLNDAQDEIGQKEPRGNAGVGHHVVVESVESGPLFGFEKVVERHVPYSR